MNKIVSVLFDEKEFWTHKDHEDALRTTTLGIGFKVFFLVVKLQGERTRAKKNYFY